MIGQRTWSFYASVLLFLLRLANITIDAACSLSVHQARCVIQLQRADGEVEESGAPATAKPATEEGEVSGTAKATTRRIAPPPRVRAGIPSWNTFQHHAVQPDRPRAFAATRRAADDGAPVPAASAAVAAAAAAVAPAGSADQAALGDDEQMGAPDVNADEAPCGANNASAPGATAPRLRSPAVFSA